MITITMIMTITMMRAREIVDGFRETKKDKMVETKKHEDENQCKYIALCHHETRVVHKISLSKLTPSSVSDVKVYKQSIICLLHLETTGVALKLHQQN